jgi:hypothetical protein
MGVARSAAAAVMCGVLLVAVTAASVAGSSSPDRSCVVSPNTDPLTKDSGADISAAVGLEGQIGADPALAANAIMLSAWGPNYATGKLDVRLANPPCPGTRTLPDKTVRGAQLYFDTRYGRGRVTVWSTYTPYPVAQAASAA